jgi:DNA-directed RNA polymerase specialized sigma24 family protein
MNSNPNPPNVTASTISRVAAHGMTIPGPATVPRPVPTAVIGPPAPANDNAARGGIPAATPLVAHPDVVRHIRATLRRYRVAPQNMDDAIADVQKESIEMARTREMPRSLAQWKALAATIAVHWALDRLREAKVRRKYDAGLCDDADAYLRPTLRWEHRDPVDTKRFLAILKELFDSGQMPVDGDEILQGIADEVPHAEIAAELGVTTTVIHNRLFRMRATFRARLVALGMLTLVLLLSGALLAPETEVAAPAPRTTPEQPAPPASSVPAWDGGTPLRLDNRPLPSEEIVRSPLK